MEMYFIYICNIFLLKMDCRRLDFTNIKCNSIDREKLQFEYCYLKAVNRSHKYISLKAVLLKKPVRQFQVLIEVQIYRIYIYLVILIQINIALFKRANGMMPLNHNVTFDGCQMIESQNPWVSFLFGLFKDHSNINHSCPYNHDIVVEKLPVQFVLQKVTAFIPFPEGDYVFSSNWIIRGVNWANVRIHASLI
ncbi:hypothetical protein KR009_007096 [Drosophila setifemur]|nr:hypothetical protein KR009_007096 [Drosophila setifemur]